MDGGRERYGGMEVEGTDEVREGIGMYEGTDGRTERRRKGGGADVQKDKVRDRWR
jgi:hypothetical protein